MQAIDWIAAAAGTAAVLAALIHTAVRRRRDGRRGGRCAGCPFAEAACRREKSGRGGPARGGRRN